MAGAVSDVPTLAADSIVVSFGGRTVLRSAWLDVTPGTVTALVGRSGTGKTTLLRVLEGSLRAGGGQVRWGGTPVSRWTAPRAVRRGVVSLPSGAWLPDHLTARATAAMVARIWGSDVGALFGALGGDESRSPAAALSGGERRLAEMAVALAARPAVLLLDEPFRGLAPVHRDRVGRLLRRLAGEGMAVGFADHDVTAVLEFADRVFALEGGRTRLIEGFRERPVAEWYSLWQSA